MFTDSVYNWLRLHCKGTPMGGPGASVLLRHTLTKLQEDELEVWLRSITNHLEKGKWAYEFWLNEDVFPGTVSRCLFYLPVEDTQKRWDEDEKRQVKELLGCCQFLMLRLGESHGQRGGLSRRGIFSWRLKKW